MLQAEDKRCGLVGMSGLGSPDRCLQAVGQLIMGCLGLQQMLQLSLRHPAALVRALLPCMQLEGRLGGSNGYMNTSSGGCHGVWQQAHRPRQAL